MHTCIANSVGRILLTTCVAGIVSVGAMGQSSAPAATQLPAPQWQPISRIDIFAGYSYLAPHGKGVTTTFADGSTETAQYSSVDLGAIGSASYFFNKYIGAQIELGAHPDGQNDGFYSLSGGVIGRYPNDEGFALFAHALGGAARIAGPNAGPGQSPYFVHPWITGPSVTVGGGMDYELPFLDHHLAVRLFQGDFEYLHGDWGSAPGMGGRANIGALRISTGLVWKMGSVIPPPPVTFTCAEAPAVAFQGDAVSITGTTTNRCEEDAKYSWEPGYKRQSGWSGGNH